MIYTQPILHSIIKGHPGASNLKIQEDIMWPLVEDPLFIPYGIAAIQHFLNFRGVPEDGICSLDSLSWKEVQIPFNYEFGSYELQQGSKTGTLPYTSGEILSGSTYYLIETEESMLHHHAVHDLESFFWVLVYICLTCNGPGGKRREELQEIFKCPKDFKMYLLDRFHPYFDPLKEMVSEWFSLLQLAFRYCSFEYANIHELATEVIERAIDQIDNKVLDEITDAGKKVLVNRAQEIAQIEAANHRALHTAGGGMNQSKGESSQGKQSWKISPPSQNHHQQMSHKSADPPELPTPKTKQLKY
ncbi:hypothetical protein CPB84DRAFT_1752941 [Gymnopilus junonius]|uniref:Fungal-type protein kinase domain-containing protein n=1 Tax=Gymnopilus junonius TaxID=109634 RepID=A0A9P5N8H8_GYMJU|nr:hypothetical protein CPB84DRAFT_1752941 [Gymnopilus junonius]